MFDFKKATKNDFSEIIGVMKNASYLDFAYKNKTVEEVAEIISNSEDTYLICFEKESKNSKHIVGYFIFGSVKNNLLEAREKFEIREDYAYHLGIGVHSDYREKGIGQRLTQYAFTQAKKKFSGMYADVSSDNIPSLKLQLSAGFEKIAEYKTEKRSNKTKNILFLKHF